MNILFVILSLLTLVGIVYLYIELVKTKKSITQGNKKNDQFLESIEKYVEIFNEQNIKDFKDEDHLITEKAASKKIEQIGKDYREKLIEKNRELTDEHEMLVDFITLNLSLLIRIPPTYRMKLIDDTTNNQMIKKILMQKLPSIKDHFIPISLLEISLSQEI